MDTIVNAALEEICARGAAGILLSDLWPLLSATAGSSIVRKSVLNSLLSLPCLRFSSSTSSSSSSRWSLEEAERLPLRVVAEEHLRDSFVGIDDLKAAGSEISETQRRVLERIAASRTSGTTQRDMAKEFGIKPNNFFYIVKNLECQQLIVRQSTILREKELGDEEGNMLKNTHISSTNLLHLRRYGNSGSLNSQQRIEITRSTCGDMLESSFDGDVASGEGVKEDILVKDYLPEMRAICDKLEEEGDKIHVVSDIKRALGYSNHPTGHRQWRNIINRMKDAELVERVNAEVENKAVPCLRLLKKFDPNDFQPKMSSSGLGKHVKRGDITEQHFELPIDYQIYDMVDAEGPIGITNFEVCRRLGLNVKKTHSRIMSIISRFGLRMESEIPDKTKAWRVWTQKNYQKYLTNGIRDPVPDKSELPAKSIEPVPFDKSSPNLRHFGSLPRDEVHPEKTHEVRSSMEIIKSNIVFPEGPPMASSTIAKQSQRYHGLASTADATKREQRILTRLKDDKFILFCELFRWLNDLNLKDKRKLMDRKTLIRTLKKLEEEGLCKHVKVTFPVATNCNRTRDENVVLHPSVDISSVLDQISKRLKLFANESHSRASSRSDNNPPVAGLALAERSSNHVDHKPALVGALSANGFVRAKMVRVKLFHCFLWGYLSSLHDWKNTLPSSEEDYDQGKHCCSVQFAIKEAIKEMPLQLFLQIIGSTKEIDDLVQKCRAGLRLSDLSVLEYKCLVDDTLVTGRLSRLVGILLRLKLIQIVGAGFVEGVDALPCPVPTHAMELRPYIEEPLPRVLKSSNIVALDLCPRQRHKFYLSNLEDVDRYWLTLECFYAKTDPIASSHAFPGSVVNEIFQLRSWDSARVMTVEQRTELLKRVKNEKQTFTFEECVKIASKLNLTVRQVYRDFCIHKDSTTSKSKVQENNVEAYHRDSCRKKRKRQRTSKNESLKYVHNDSETRAPSCRATLSTPIFEGNNMDTNFLMPSDTEINDDPMEESKDDSYGNTPVDFNSQGEDGQSFTFIRRCAFSRIKPTRQKRFSWTDILDRQLIMRYVRIRVVKGARFHHVDWFSLADLPALPGTCRRRMAALRRDKSIRSAIMKLCNLLADRYTRHLDTLEKGTPSQNDGMSVQRADLDEFLTSDAENSSVSGIQPKCWDDFSDPDIEIAVNEILRCKRMAKLERARRIGASQVKGWTDNPQTEGTILDDQEHVMPKEQSSIPSNLVENDGSHNKRWKKNTNTSGRSRARCHQSHAKFLKLLNNRGIKIRREVCESLAAANAVELVKLVFLSNSAALQASLAATLRLYSESDLFVAFSYLKEKDFMIVGQGNQPFKLSSKFWHGASSSIFPIDSGKRAVEFSSWLHRQYNDLEDGVDLTSDLQCGEIFHLFALVSLEEVLISPCMPKEGTGEPDEPKSPKSLLPMDDLYGFDEQTNLKRKRDDNRQCISESLKKQKAEGKMDGELFNRREKGFPGIKVLITRPKFKRADVAPCVIDNKNQTCLSVSDDASKPTSCSNMEITMAVPSSNDLILPCNFSNSAQSGMPLNEPPWDMMVKYAANLSSTSDGMNEAMSFHPELFKTIHSVICKAGEQGLTIEEIAKTMGNEEIKLVEVAVDTLETFQLAYKVNAYDCMKVVDSSYRSKYFISMLADHNQDGGMVCPMISQAMSYEGSQEISRRKHDKNENQDARSANLSCGHEVRPINLPPRSCVPCVETPHGGNAVSGEGKFSEAVSVENDYGNKACPTTSIPLVYRPILPWINSDGSSNTIMYKGLTRRVLGTVMQKPGILEEDLIGEMDVLNPQTCRKLLETMVCDNHIIVRTMLQTTSAAPPSILQSLFNSKIIEPKLELRKHYFANPMSTSLL
ncbi:uncharacterized protein M6B38_364900 [Iris pallida]|uniref:B-block binding subunit of TFIIIC domain-containing protein n=1 Tax=Iris pallida TaxID=29817 RepID=A0AAX6GIR6_IRIPA|nr:uncharacterized protein M6B38_206270 [Iris pallida]KAJ6828185.1 uncharacterized protein M6B38_364900 [Iris pallida]